MFNLRHKSLHVDCNWIFICLNIGKKEDKKVEEEKNEEKREE